MSKILSEEIRNRRQWMQEQITSLESRIRRRLRGKLLQTGWYDIDDILASVRRRLDAKVAEGELPVSNEEQLNHLIFTIAQRVGIDKYRQARRQRCLEQSAARGAEHTIHSRSPDVSQLLETVLPALSREDQHLLKLWVNGLSQKQIASELGISLEAYRTRRKRLIARARGGVASVVRDGRAGGGGRRCDLAHRDWVRLRPPSARHLSGKERESTRRGLTNSAAHRASSGREDADWAARDRSSAAHCRWEVVHARS